MLKLKKVIFAAIMIALIANITYASSTPKGKPFLYLEEQIDELREKIDALEGNDTTGLQEQIDQLTLYVDSFFDIFVKVDVFNNKMTELEDRLCFGECQGVLEPVCGQDSKTYVNSCAANCADVEIISQGACETQCIPSDEICDGLDNNCNGLVDEGGICEEEITCCIDEGCFSSTIEECRASMGAVMECMPVPGENPPSPSVPVNFTQTDPAGNQSSWLINLTQEVNKTGVHTQPYVPGTHDCEDFADELERNLTAKNYSATFTYYWCKRPDGTYYGHAVTDIHAPDGTMVWIEPQTGKVINLDFDGDGTAEARNNHVNNKDSFTDDNCAIEVFESKAAAEAAGVQMD